MFLIPGQTGGGLKPRGGGGGAVKFVRVKRIKQETIGGGPARGCGGPTWGGGGCRHLHPGGRTCENQQFSIWGATYITGIEDLKPLRGPSRQHQKKKRKGRKKKRENCPNQKSKPSVSQKNTRGPGWEPPGSTKPPPGINPTIMAPGGGTKKVRTTDGGKTKRNNFFEKGDGGCGIKDTRNHQKKKQTQRLGGRKTLVASYGCKMLNSAL